MTEKQSLDSYHLTKVENPPNKPPDVDAIIKKIPLPNQLPKAMDFTDIPPAALKSSTLETLISQNEDLMARLSISLRRNNQLEERASILEAEHAAMRSRLETISDQFLIVREKDRLESRRGQTLVSENSSLKTKFEKLEKAYASLFVQAQAFQRRLVHLERYRARIRKAAPQVQNQAKRLRRAEFDLTKAHKALSISHIQTVNTFEAKLTEVKNELEFLRQKAADRDAIFEDKVRFENLLLFEQRQHEISRKSLQATIDRLDEENARIRIEIKESLVVQESLNQEIAQFRQELPSALEKETQLREQVESLQALWSHKQREQEQLEAKNRGLQKLNQNLSITLNQQRKEIQQLKDSFERERFAFQQKIKVLTDEAEMLRRYPQELPLDLPSDLPPPELHSDLLTDEASQDRPHTPPMEPLGPLEPGDPAQN